MIREVNGSIHGEIDVNSGIIGEGGVKVAWVKSTPGRLNIFASMTHTSSQQMEAAYVLQRFNHETLIRYKSKCRLWIATIPIIAYNNRCIFITLSSHYINHTACPA